MIKSPMVRLIDAEGVQRGEVSLTEALQYAKEVYLDLVEVAPEAKPPVCRVIDYGKYRYEQSKKVKESKKHQKLVVVKEVKMRPNIDRHDLKIKVDRAHKFLLDGCKVKFTVTFRGRQMAHTDIGFRIMRQVIEDLKEVSILERNPKLEGSNITTIMNALKDVHK